MASLQVSFELLPVGFPVAIGGALRQFLELVGGLFDRLANSQFGPGLERFAIGLVGFPFLYSAPGIFPILAKKLALRGLSPDLTGAFSVPPVCAL